MPQKYISKKSCILCNNCDCLMLDSKLRLVQCKKCKLVFRDAAAFDKLHYGKCEIYLNKRENIALNYARERDVHHRFDIICKVINCKGKLLDIGCNDGISLLEAKKRGFDVFGCEPNKEMRRYAIDKKLDVIEGTLDSSLNEIKKKGPFEVVTICHVLEHLADPLDGLIKIKALIPNGGHLVVEVPDYGSPWQKIWGMESQWCYEEHLFNFTKKTLNRLLLKAGFKIVFKHSRNWDQFNRDWRQNLVHLPGFTESYRLVRFSKRAIKYILDIKDTSVAIKPDNKAQEKSRMKMCKYFLGRPLGMLIYWLNRGDYILFICKKC